MTRWPAANRGGATATAANPSTRCYNCNQFNHFARDCPNRRRFPGRANIGMVEEENGPRDNEEGQIEEEVGAVDAEEYDWEEYDYNGYGQNTDAWSYMDQTWVENEPYQSDMYMNHSF